MCRITVISASAFSYIMPDIFAAGSSLNQEACLSYDGRTLAIRCVAKDIETCAKASKRFCWWNGKKRKSFPRDL